MEDRKSWQIKEEAILDDLVTLMDLSSDEKAILAALKPQAEVVSLQLADAFYSRLQAHAPTAEYVTGQIEDRKMTLKNWFLHLFEGDYGSDYVQSRLRIGWVHVRIGLPVRYPLAMMDVILRFGQEVARQSPQPDKALVAFQKLLSLDIAIFNQAYEDTQLKHLTEVMGNERLARRLLTQ